MSQVLRRAVHDLGTLVKIYAALPLATVAVALASLERYAIPGFAFTAILSYGLGVGIERAFDADERSDGHSDDPGMRSGVIAVADGDPRRLHRTGERRLRRDERRRRDRILDGDRSRRVTADAAAVAIAAPVGRRHRRRRPGGGVRQQRG